MSGPPDDQPDIEIGAFAKAKKLRFKKAPKTEIEFEGEPEIESFSGSERKNLPDKVEPSVTYRDVVVGWRAAAKLRPPDEDEDKPAG
jgi:hypothetical protein